MCKQCIIYVTKEKNMAEMKISGIYKITNTVTGDFYIGSSKDVKRRWSSHKWPSALKKCPNNPMYLDFQKYGTDKFAFEILEKVESEHLKEKEQQFIETLKPTYNSNRANGWDIERNKKWHKEYYQQNRERYNEKHKEYYQQNREKRKEYQDKYNNQQCLYNGESLTLATLTMRFQKAGIAHPTQEAKKYLVL